MQACEGYVENGRFHPTGILTWAPTRLRAVLTVLDEVVAAPAAKDRQAFWSEFDRAAAASERECLREEDFPRMKFGRESAAWFGGE